MDVLRIPSIGILDNNFSYLFMFVIYTFVSIKDTYIGCLTDLALLTLWRIFCLYIVKHWLCTVTIWYVQ